MSAAEPLPSSDVAVVAACAKWVDLRPGVDAVHGHLVPSVRGGGFSPADEAAIEVALHLAQCWGAECVLVCAGPAEAEGELCRLGAAGAHRVVRVEHSTEQDSSLTADVLASVLGPGDLGAEVVVCGDLSFDRGSGAVPALLAHHLGATQALGLMVVEATAPGVLRAVRRLDGGRREVLDVPVPSVLSVEGSAAVLRRAPLAPTIAAATATPVERRDRRLEGHVEPPRLRPWRPRARVLAGPAGATAFERVVSLTGALLDRTPPRTIEAEPARAAELILGQLADWGYLDRDPPAPSGGNAAAEAGTTP